MGFKWQKADTPMLLMEKPDVVMKRFAFLREYMNNLTAGVSRTPVFLDETWIGDLIWLRCDTDFIWHAWLVLYLINNSFLP
jgi:hypothetical protein